MINPVAMHIEPTTMARATFFFSTIPASTHSMMSMNCFLMKSIGAVAANSLGLTPTSTCGE